jgi:hypothetical protein
MVKVTIRKKFCEELERVFNKFLNCFLEDWNENLVTLNIFVQKVVDGSFQEAVNILI